MSILKNIKYFWIYCVKFPFIVLLFLLYVLCLVTKKITVSVKTLKLIMRHMMCEENINNHLMFKKNVYCSNCNFVKLLKCAIFKIFVFEIIKMLAIKFASTVKLLMHKLKCLKKNIFSKGSKSQLCPGNTHLYQYITSQKSLCFVLFKRFWGKIWVFTFCNFHYGILLK